MWFPSKDAQNFLSNALELPATGFEQDWEIELSNPERLSEFVQFLANKDLFNDRKQALAALILASFEDAHWQGILLENIWNQFTIQIIPEMEVYREVLMQWVTCEEDGFGISKDIQNLIAQSKMI